MCAFRINVPSDLADLKGFLCPALCDHDLLYETVSTFDHSKVPRHLLTASEKVTALVKAHHGDKHLLTSMIVDFEACYKPPQGSAAHHNQYSSQQQHQVALGKVMKGVAATATGNEQDFRFRYVVLGWFV